MVISLTREYTKILVILINLILIFSSISYSVGESDSETLQMQDQIDCNNYCLGLGQPAGDCWWSGGLGSELCPGYTNADSQGSVGTCRSLIGTYAFCYCCYNSGCALETPAPSVSCSPANPSAGVWTCNNWYNEYRTCGVDYSECDGCGEYNTESYGTFQNAVALPQALPVGTWDVRAYAYGITFDETRGCGSECVFANDFSVRFTGVHMRVFYFVMGVQNLLNSAEVTGNWLSTEGDGCPVCTFGPQGAGDIGFDWTTFTCPSSAGTGGCPIEFNWYSDLYGFANEGATESDEHIYGKMHITQAKVEWRGETGCTSGTYQDCYTNGDPINGDKGRQLCTSGTWGTCQVSCATNADCGVNRCCIAAGPDSTKKTCQGKGTYDSNPAYLCDPGTWIKCDESNLGSIQEFENRIFVCNKEGGSYAWKEVSNILYEIAKILAALLIT